MTPPRRLTLAAVCLALAACSPAVSTSPASGGSTSSASGGSTSSASGGSSAGSATGGRVTATALPLGDGHVSSTPEVGDVDSCRQSFGAAGGAQAVGPWVNTGAGTWDSTAKVHVQGSVSWPSAAFSVSVSGGTRTVAGKDLPVGHTTGVFPVASSDPASAYDRNPNRITPQSFSWTLPANPGAAASPSCTPGGVIGVLTDGVFLFNALDSEGRDAAAHEVLDSCDEHPQMNGQLHHHSVGSCLLAAATGSSTLVGYAIDGYGIYAERDAAGSLLTDADLDACHGRTSTVEWNGAMQSVYHYDATLEYPYTIGCFHGTPVSGAGGS